VRRFAREVGVDLARVTGSGPSGRITREDILAVVRQASHSAASAKPTTATARDNWGPIRPEKVTKIRKLIAAKMHESWTTCPRVTNFDDADVTELERLRVSSKDDYAKKGIKLTSLPFVIKAVASALKNHPTINASLDLQQEQIIYKEYVNIGIAVDTERGLVVPSLRSADEMSIPDVARALAQLSDNVRDGHFTPADLQGSTFTISNLGAIGGTYSTPIINTPEVAILLVGRSRKMPVVIDDEIAIRLMMPLSLSYDHRLVDGATAARFLNDVIDFLEAPSRLLLAP
jgi:pyruvate dehydrogenase E2 component (dihydrolipoamide acetyltransferase)